jgi:hypothetical protein
MIDWKQPLEWNGRPVTFIGCVPGVKQGIIHYSYGDLIYRVDLDTGRVLHTGYCENKYVKNTVPEWKKAFDQYCIEEAEDRTEEYIFQRGFYYGRNW